MEPCSKPFPPPPPLPRPTGESSQRAGCPVERKERAEFWLERAARTIVQRTRGHRASPLQGLPGIKVLGRRRGSRHPTVSHSGAPASSVQDLCAWPGETGDPRGYEATASFLFPWPHPIPLAGSQVQAPARTNDSQEGQRGGACDAARIPAPWGLNLPGSALQQVLFVHGRHAAFSQCALEVARGATAERTHLPLGSRRCAPRPPALSPALATPCEAARGASCAKARGEGEG